MSKAVTFQRCDACGTAQTLRRLACQACGGGAFSRRTASGGGIVHAITTIHRAPDETFRGLAPYAVALADMDEGFRLMGMAAAGLTIGDRILARRASVGGRAIVRFEREDQG